MKKIYTIVLFFLLIPLHAQQQSRYPINSTSSWRIDLVYDGIETIHHSGDDIYKYFVNGDTLINAVNYYKIYKSGTAYYSVPFNYSNIYVGGLRDSNNKFYFIRKNENVEITIFDFNLKNGDTIVSELNGQISTIFQTDSLPDGRKVFSCYSSHVWGGKCSTGQIIEGIGNTGGLLEEMPCYHPGLQEHFLICYSEDDNILYNGSLISGTCDLVASYSLANNYKPDIKVYPVPSKGIINIEPGNFPLQNIEIFDILGNLVYSKGYGNQINFRLDLNVENFKKGIYLLRLKGIYDLINRKIIIR
jgi:hypothetical protein